MDNGINLAGAVEYGSEYPFVNIMKGSMPECMGKLLFNRRDVAWCLFAGIYLKIIFYKNN